MYLYTKFSQLFKDFLADRKKDNIKKAVLNGDPALVIKLSQNVPFEMLLDKEQKGKTLFHIAVNKDDYSTLSALIQRIPPEKRFEVFTKTLVLKGNNFLLSAVLDGDIFVVNSILNSLTTQEAIKLVRMTNAEKHTVLHLASNLGIAKIMLEYKADILALDNEGYTPLGALSKEIKIIQNKVDNATDEDASLNHYLKNLKELKNYLVKSGAGNLLFVSPKVDRSMLPYYRTTGISSKQAVSEKALTLDEKLSFSNNDKIETNNAIEETDKRLTLN